MKKVALVGAGNRTINYNLPILKQMQDKIKIVGVTTKSGKVGQESGLTDTPVFNSITTMVKETNPDAVIVSIKSSVVATVLDELLSLDTLVLLETTDDFQVYNKIKNSATSRVGILEQWPYLPMEQLKKSILEEGFLGRVLVVENNFRTYDYHGSAQVRNYLSTQAKIESLKGFTNTYESEPFVGKDGEFTGASVEGFRIKAGVFDDGTLLIYKYSDKHKKMPFRGHNTLNIHGTMGSIVSGCLSDEYCDINILDEEGVTHNLQVLKKYDDEDIKKLSITIPNSKREIVWENKYNGLSEHQIATGYLFEEMLIKGNIIYSAEDAIQDMIIAYTQ